MKTKKENCTDHLLFITMVGYEVDDCICLQQRCSNVGWMEWYLVSRSLMTWLLQKSLCSYKLKSPKYVKVFVAMGSFHMELAMFAAIGKYIAKSGGEYLLNETHVIEKGSLNRFLHGKNDNRCKRSH